MIPALVLTAGLGTRLRPLSLVRAKAAMPVAGEPLARRILRQLHAAGVRDAVLNLHHLPHTITREVGDGSDLGLRVRYSWEMPVLGSAGGPRQALPLLGEATVLIVNGDTLTGVDLGALAAEHRRTGALVTMAVVPNREPEKYGSVLVDEAGVVTGFTGRRTSAPSHPRTLAHFVGVQVASADAFASVTPGAAAESVGHLYPRLIQAQPGSVRTFVADAPFFDIGTPEDYLRTSLRLAAGNGAALRGARARVGAAARIEDSVLWNDVEVGAGASLRRSVVADGVSIPAGTVWADVTVRRADGPLAPNEQRAGDLAVAPMHFSDNGPCPS